SAALTSRGINVDVVRARLRDFGELVDVKPRIIPGGVACDFTVAVEPGIVPDEHWRDDGLRWTAVAATADNISASSATEAAVVMMSPAEAAIGPSAVAMR